MATNWKRKVESLFGKYNVDMQLVDVFAEFDDQAPEESFRKIEEKVKLLSKRVEIPTKKDIEQADIEATVHYVNEMEGKLKEAMSALVVEQPKVSGYYKQLREYERMVIRGYRNNLVVTGSGGIGKTMQIIKVNLEDKREIGKDYIIKSGFTTPLRLYVALYENMDKHIIFDDVDGVLNSERGIALLKGAMEQPIGRWVEYDTSSDKLPEDIPKRFLFEGSITIILNKIHNISDPSLQALLTRAIHCNVEFSHRDIVGLLYAVCGEAEYKGLSKDERLEVVKYITTYVDESVENLNIRTLFKCYDAYIYAKNEGGDWKTLADGFFTFNKNLKRMGDLMKSGLGGSELMKKFEEETGIRRSRGYDYKEMYLEKIGERFNTG